MYKRGKFLLRLDLFKLLTKNGFKIEFTTDKKEYTRVVTGFILDIHDDMVEKRQSRAPSIIKSCLRKGRSISMLIGFQIKNKQLQSTGLVHLKIMYYSCVSLRIFQATRKMLGCKIEVIDIQRAKYTSHQRVNCAHQVLQVCTF